MPETYMWRNLVLGEGKPLYGGQSGDISMDGRMDGWMNV
jgi:hypothetical protein